MAEGSAAAEHPARRSIAVTDPSNVMVLHTDGLATRWRWEDFPHLAKIPAEAVAWALLRALATGDDDATVAVVRDVVP